MHISVRPMLAADLQLGMRLKAEAGWNQVEADWKRALELEPDGCFVALVDGEPVGTATTCTFGPVAWVAMVLVDTRFRGRGVGRALLEHALTHLDARGVTSIRLDATPAGRMLYEKLGFAAEYELARFAGLPIATGRSWPQAEAATHADVSQIIALDRLASGTNRGRLLEYVLAGQCAAGSVVRSRGQIIGCCLHRAGARARQIGPCLGEEPAALPLLAEAFDSHAGQPVYVDIPRRQQPACELALARGLAIQRLLLRMTRGPIINERPGLLWASFGPEKG